MPGRPGRRILLVPFLVLAHIGCGVSSTRREPLRTARDVTSLSEGTAAAGLPVELRGTVTLLDPDWELLAIQDETGGVLVDPAGRPQDLRIGDRVAVKGATSVDNHVPSIVSATIRKLAPAPSPRPEAVSLDALACGEVLYRLVEVEIRPDEGSFGDSVHTARFVTDGPCRGLVVYGRLFPQHAPGSLVGRRIRVRGVPVPTYSPSGGIDQMRLMFDGEESVDILETPADLGARPGAPGGRTITSVKEVKLLPRVEAARAYQVRAEGVVTALNPRTDGYFLQDAGIGIFVFASTAKGRLPSPGERVRVTGWTNAGGYAPIIYQGSMESLGTAGLPDPVKLQPGDVFAGVEENVWAELDAVPMGVVNDGRTTQLEVSSGSKRIKVWFSDGASPESLQPLLDAEVALRGVYSPLYTASGALSGFRVFTSSPQMLRVVTPPPASEVRTIASIAGFDLRGTPRHRIQVSGSVTYRDTSGRIYLQDGSHALHVMSAGADAPPLHAQATAEGFVVGNAQALQLEHVRWLTAQPGSPVPPIQTAAESMQTGEWDGLLVSVEAYLNSRRTSGGELQLNLQAGRTRFDAYLEAPGSADAFPTIRAGALLRLTGICESRLESGPAGSRRAVLRMRSAGDMTVVTPAPWWDLRRALYAAWALSLLLVIALGTAVQLRRNLAKQAAVRSQLEQQLLHAQRLESIGRLAGGVAHDFNNYLTVIVGHAALLESTLPDRETRASAAAIREVGERAAALTRQLLAFSRKQVLRPRVCDLNTIISNARTTLLPLIGEQVEIDMRLAPIEPVAIDPDQFFQVLVNLSVNARDAMPGGGRLTLATRMVDFAADTPGLAEGLRPGRYVCLSVTDTGIGMDDATRKRAFDPFFTTKEPGRGTGLGLAVVFGIVAQSDGHLEVHSAVGKGTTFDIYLPVAAAEQPADAPGPAAVSRAPEPSHRV